MTIKQILITSTAALALLTASSFVHAQTIETRIGKLDLQVGYPSKATAETLYDEMDFQRATQAFIWALPAVGFHGLHLAHRNTFGAKDGDVVLYQSLKDKAGMLTPNLTTLYLMTFCLPRFLEQSFDEKLITLFHELYHISPKFEGDLRRMGERCHVHSHSKREYDARMALLARAYLSGGAERSLHDFLRMDFAQLRHRHGGVVGVTVPRPRLLPVTGESAKEMGEVG